MRKVLLFILAFLMTTCVPFVSGQDLGPPSWEMGWETDMDSTYLVELEDDWDLSGELVFFINNDRSNELDVDLTYDYDEDGIIDFEDKCPKTFGVSGDDDVHGCPIETKGTFDSISTISMGIGGSIGLVLFAGLIGLFLVRRRRIRALENEFDESDENFYDEDFYDEVVSSFSPSNETSQLPPLHAEGQQIDGYETIEYPADSGTWYYRDEDSGEWIEWV